MAVKESPRVDGSPSAVLASVRDNRARAEAAQLAVLFDALDWADMHSPEAAHLDEWATVPGTEGELSLTGEGAPRILEFCIAEFAAAGGMSTDAGRHLIADAVELRYRLPRIWRRLAAGQVPVWRARLVSQRTRLLSQDAVAWVDRQLAPFVAKIGPIQAQRAVDAAVIRFDPGHAEERRDSARYAKVQPEVGPSGGVLVEAMLDAPDAFDLELAISREAELRATLGDDADLDVRRARALGDLARRQLGLELTAETVDGRAISMPPRPATSLYFHLPSDTAGLGDVPFTLGNRTGGVLSLETVIDWLRLSGSSVHLRPVIDLDSTRATTKYAPTLLQREHVFLRDETCVFPHCNRPARPPGHRSGVDADHIKAYDDDGPTSTDNLAALCRHHHRHKTFTAWTYSSPEPGVYLWTSPHGLSFVRTPHGTHEVVRPPPLDSG